MNRAYDGDIVTVTGEGMKKMRKGMILFIWLPIAQETSGVKMLTLLVYQAV